MTKKENRPTPIRYSVHFLFITKPSPYDDTIKISRGREFMANNAAPDAVMTPVALAYCKAVIAQSPKDEPFVLRSVDIDQWLRLEAEAQEPPVDDE